MTYLRSDFRYKWVAVILVAMAFALLPRQAEAQWPPFTFRMTPTHENGRIFYDLRFTQAQSLDWTMRNIRINIPLPEGTRFIEATGLPNMDTSFDGAEVRFFAASMPKRNIKGFSFEVEVIDPAVVTYNTNAWIGWEGNVPGSFTTQNFSINTSRQTLEWGRPAQPKLEARTEILTSGNQATYVIYPRLRGRLWDVNISVPIPEGASVLSIDAPSTLQFGSNEQEVAFGAVELENQNLDSPIRIEFDTTNVPGNNFTSHIWTSWKNVGRNVGISVDPLGAYKTPDFVIPTQNGSRTIIDLGGDAVFPGYDLAAVTFNEVVLPKDYGRALKVTFRVNGPLTDDNGPVQLYVYFDEDCQQATGARINYIGAEAFVRYRHDSDRVDFSLYDAETRKWENIERLPFQKSVDNQSLTVWVPYELLGNRRQFCWISRGRYITTQFASSPVSEWLPDYRDSNFIRYVGSGDITSFEPDLPLFDILDESKKAAKRPKRVPIPPLVDAGSTWQYLPGWANPDEDWNSVDFDDSYWFAGAAPIGYATNPRSSITETLVTDLGLTNLDTFSGDVPSLILYTNPRTGGIIAVPPSGQERSVFLRQSFVFTNPEIITKLKLEINYRDGFVAYLNGVEVARRNLGNAGSPVDIYSNATKRNRKGAPNRIDLTGFIPTLIPGENVLAIQVHQAFGEYADSLMMDAWLTAR
ncbi:MAG: hypothetical protein AAF629_12930 [Chloroflexota bacterium]